MLKATLKNCEFFNYKPAKENTRVIAIGYNQSQLAEAVNEILREHCMPKNSSIVIEDFKNNKIGEFKI